MKKFFYVAVMALALTACGNAKKADEAKLATDVVPNAMTDVVPNAATECAEGQVLTEEVPNAMTDLVPNAATDVVPAE